MRRSEGLRLLRVVLALSLFASCGPDRTEHEPRYVHAHMSVPPASLSLIGNIDRNSDIIAYLISDGLVRYDASLVAQPLLARAWEVSPDGLIWTFHLREGVKWHDGAPVTAKDVVFTVQKVRDPKTQARSYFGQFDSIVSIEAPDPLTVRVKYSVPYADAIDSWTMPILPEHIAGKDQDLLTGEFVRHPVGCGPFRFAHFDRSRELALEANPDYWDGPPSIDGIVFRFLPDERTAYQALLREDLDLLTVTPALWKESTTAPRAHPLARFQSALLSGWCVHWNEDGSNPFFLDPRVRRALVLALDRPRFISKILFDFARSAVGTWHPETAWFDRTLEPWPFDPQLAAKLLDEAGWRDRDGDGVRDRDGKPFSFELLIAASTQELNDRMAAWFQESLHSVGVDVRIQKLEWTAFRERRQQHQFQAAMSSLNFGPIPDQFELYHSTSAAGGVNFGSFHDEEVDRLLEEGRLTFDPAKRREIYDRLQRRVHELEPISALFHLTQPVLHDARLTGIEPSPRGFWFITPGPRRWRWNPTRGAE